MSMGFCEQCGKEYEGERCPVCGSVLLPEVNPEEMPPAQVTWHGGFGRKSDEIPWPEIGGEPEEPVLLTELPDVGGDCQLLESRLRAYRIPDFTRYPGCGALGKVVLGFSGFGVQVFVPRSRLEEAVKLLDLF